jgi:hypothetical protein
MVSNVILRRRASVERFLNLTIVIYSGSGYIINSD